MSAFLPQRTRDKVRILGQDISQLSGAFDVDVGGLPSFIGGQGSDSDAAPTLPVPQGARDTLGSSN